MLINSASNNRKFARIISYFLIIFYTPQTELMRRAQFAWMYYR